jgi:hypothetical protein
MSAPRPNRGTALIVVAVIGIWLYVQDADYSAEHGQAAELEAAQQDAAALASREFAGQQVCGPAAEAIWIDDKTLTCQPKRGQAYSVAGVKP